LLLTVKAIISASGLSAKIFWYATLNSPTDGWDVVGISWAVDNRR